MHSRRLTRHRTPAAVPGFLLTTTLGCLTVPGSAGEPPPDPVLYELSAPSEFIEGCFEPCACPVWLSEDLTGRFTLQPAEPEGRIQVFVVTQVKWVFPFIKEAARVTGAGTYRYIPGLNPMQRMELVLTVDDREPATYDSGWMPVVVTRPALEFTVSRNGSSCFDTVFQVAAKPASVTPVKGSTWGELKRRY